MRFRDKNDHPGDRISDVRNTLMFLCDLLNALPRDETLELPLDSREGLGAILFACAVTLDDIE